VPPTSLFLAAISLAIWLYLTLARGIFWRLSPFHDDQAKHPSLLHWPPVIAIIPARNEAETIGQTIAALVQQDYPGEFFVIVVDDHSEDKTSQIAQRSAKQGGAESRISICTASSLPPGWTGKLWALNEGLHDFSLLAKHPREGAAAPEGSFRASAFTYFWFTDADVVHAPDTLRRLVCCAEQNKLDLASLMVLLRTETLPERALIPAFLFFFLKLYPPSWTANPKSRTAGAAGGCILVRREALDRIGGLAAIRSEVIDDCALARAVKRSGGKIWMGLTRTSRSLRAYATFAEIRYMIARTAFTQLGYSKLLLLGTLVGMFLTYLVPIAFLVAHNHATRLLALASWLTMTLLFLPTVGFYRLSPLWAPLLPLSAVFYAHATWLSALRFWLNRGAQWKGRSQAPRAF
jgi:hopene-associated glycosyltransferase HpnB